MIKPKKSLGQNFLVNSEIIDKIVKCGILDNNDNVVEVGPGTGALTIKILESEPKNFTVIEKDSRFIDILSQKFGNKIKIINKDMIDIAYEKFGENNFIIFGNYLQDLAGQVFVFFVLTVVAAESAIGLAIIVVLYRNKQSINVDDIGRLKG